MMLLFVLISVFEIGGAISSTLQQAPPSQMQFKPRERYQESFDMTLARFPRSRGKESTESRTNHHHRDLNLYRRMDPPPDDTTIQMEPVNAAYQAKRTKSGQLADKESGGKFVIKGDGGGKLYFNEDGLLRQKSAEKEIELVRSTSGSGRLYNPQTLKEVAGPKGPSQYVRTLEKTGSGHIDNKILSESRSKWLTATASLASLPGTAYAPYVAKGLWGKTFAGMAAGASTVGLGLNALKPAKVSAKAAHAWTDLKSKCKAGYEVIAGACRAKKDAAKEKIGAMKNSVTNTCQAGYQWVAGQCQKLQRPPRRAGIEMQQQAAPGQAAPGNQRQRPGTPPPRSGASTVQATPEKQRTAKHYSNRRTPKT